MDVGHPKRKDVVSLPGLLIHRREIMVVKLWIRVSDFSVNILRCCRDHFSPPALFEPSPANNLISATAGVPARLGNRLARRQDSSQAFRMAAGPTMGPDLSSGYALRF